MLNILLSGCYGKLARAVIEFIETQHNVRVLAGVDPGPAARAPLTFPVFRSPGEVEALRPDVIIDCSHPVALPALLEYALRKQMPAVLATTGYGQAEFLMIEEAARLIPIFQSGNMSLGVALLQQLVLQAATVLGDSCDIEIIEAHHNQKIDAPSGTAYMLGDAVNAGLSAPRPYEFNRQAKRTPRNPDEIGMHSVRGGTLAGEHTVLFAGFDEVVEITHKAYSKRIFAVGCVNAARFMAEPGRAAGRYSMADLVNPCA